VEGPPVVHTLDIFPTFIKPEVHRINENGQWVVLHLTNLAYASGSLC
jgi:hypothetical protein